MKEWLKRIRGILGLGSAGAVAGALFGGLWWLVTSVLGIAGIVVGDVWVTATVWGFFGAFAAGGAGLFLTAFGRHRALEELSAWRVGAFGALMGFLAPSAFLLLVSGRIWGPTVLLFAVTSALVGGALGSGLVLTAQRAPSEALTPGSSGSGARELGKTSDG